MTNQTNISLEECKTLNCSHSGATFLIDQDDYPLPNTYLKFAIADLESEESDRAYVNAVSNAKRALHFQVDILADALGVQQTKRPNNFPSKLEFCVKCGIAGKRILKKLNTVRNQVEHDYYIPTKQEAEDYVDVVELFLSSTRPALLMFPKILDFENDEEIIGFLRSVVYSLELEPETGILKIKTRRFPGPVQEFKKIFLVKLKEKLDQSVDDSEPLSPNLYKTIEKYYQEYTDSITTPNVFYTESIIRKFALELAINCQIQISVKDDENTYCAWVAFMLDSLYN